MNQNTAKGAAKNSTKNDTSPSAPPSVSLGANQREKLLARLGIIAKLAQHRAGNRLAVDLLHASHDHAHVPVEQKMKQTF